MLTFVILEEGVELIERCDLRDLSWLMKADLLVLCERSSHAFMVYVGNKAAVCSESSSQLFVVVLNIRTEKARVYVWSE